jgi:hypothetical protein
MKFRDRIKIDLKKITKDEIFNENQNKKKNFID